LDPLVRCLIDPSQRSSGSIMWCSPPPTSVLFKIRGSPSLFMGKWFSTRRFPPVAQNVLFTAVELSPKKTRRGGGKKRFLPGLSPYAQGPNFVEGSIPFLIAAQK